MKNVLTQMGITHIQLVDLDLPECINTRISL